MRTLSKTACALVAFFAAYLAGCGSAIAQDYWRRHDSAQAQLNRAGREERFSLAAERCQTSIADRRAEWMVIWCDLASRAAMRQRDRDDRRDFSEAERALLWDAAWLQALEGIQDDGFFAAPLVERVSIADDVSTRRLITYRLLSNLRSRDYRDIDHYLRQLAGLDGVSISAQDTLLAGRRQLLDALLAQERAPERLWAVAATALTYEFEYRSAAVSREDIISDARDMAQRIEPLVAEVDALTGQDVALKPLLLYGRAIALMVASDYATALTAANEGYTSCIEGLWRTASLCLDLGLAAGTAKVLGELVAANPERMRLPAETPLSSRQRGEEYTEARCRVIVVGDVSDAGEFIDPRIVYENPIGACSNMALRYATARNYRPISQAQLGARRQDILIRFVLTSP